MNGRLLVFNCHEAWVFQLRLLQRPMDIIVDLPGRHVRDWDEAVRPIPPFARVVSLAEARKKRERYACIIAHNLSDLLDIKALRGPRILVIHLTLDGMILEQRAKTDAQEFRAAVAKFVEMTHTQVMAVSQLKARSWGFGTGCARDCAKNGDGLGSGQNGRVSTPSGIAGNGAEDIVRLTADPADYLPWRGELAAGLRIASFVQRRPRTLLWDFHQKAFEGIPVTLVGHNPEMPGVRASRSWEELKEILQQHRFYVHTADPRLEDGYNTATLEAMAAGLPVLGNCHPSSPVVHGVSGYLSDDPGELAAYAKQLLGDRGLAERMGQAARETVREGFSGEAFRAGVERAMEKAAKRWSGES
jgi:hypothetical protein